MEEARPPFSDTAENRKLMLEGLVDLLTLTMLLRTTPLRDSAHKTAQNVGQSAAAKASDELDEQIKQFKLDMPIMQQDAVRWIQGAVIRDFKPELKDVED